MAIVAVFIPLGLLALLVALGRYEELVLPPLAEDSEAPDGAALAGRATGGDRQSADRAEAGRT